MTRVESAEASPFRGASSRSPGTSAANDLTARLREVAGRMVPFSEHKILLRAAASAIERLDAEVRGRAAEIARLTAELKGLRAAVRSA
jgi:hypothetical protein